MKANQKNQTRIWIILALAAVFVLAGCSVTGGLPRAGATPAAGESGVVGTIEIAENVEASGTVKAAQDAILTWKTSGTVEEVLVQPGDRVKTGDTLASLILTSVPANVLAAQADLINAQVALDNLSPTALQIVQAEQVVAQAQDLVEERQRVVDGLGTPARQADIDQANATVLLAKIQLDKAWDRYKPYQNKPDNNQIKAALYNRWAEAQQQYDQAVRRLNNLKGVSVNSVDLELAEANLALAQAQLQDAQEKVDELKAGADPNDVAAAEARITAAQATLSAISIAAPFDSEVLSVDVQPGDVVNAGQPAFTIANREQLHVDTLIDETEIANLKLGDKVELTLDTLGGKTLTGVVSFINPKGETVSGNVKFQVRIDLDPVDVPVLLGATADVNILINEPRKVLSVPVRAIQTDDNGEYVILLNPDGATQRIDVVTGQLIGDQVVILTGDLQEGDVLLFTEASNEMLERMNSMGQ